MVRVTGVADETPTVRTIRFEDPGTAAALPGQFAMVWVPGGGELPMSVMAGDPGGAAFTVRRHGPASTALYGVDRGDLIGVRGPYGNTFDVREGRLLLAGGGTGMVPMMRLAMRVADPSRVVILMGARTAPEVIFERAAAALGDVVISTDDGSRGEEGTAVDAARRLLGSGRFSAAYVCGPEPMMAGIVAEARSRGVFVQASIERPMKCGVGICGSCCMGDRLVCSDGTVFDGDRLAATGEFGAIYRDKAGIARRY
ncbi:MAG: dihydroorotate dehydrogenase electron transfer subunit [Nitrosopumilus sp.]|nr:dihydroorotate dehydrogenase electron transfer subunit [Nitrosopumilus sp.]